ncbi:MAG TPA: VWA domain-containing protein [Pyrinomonadaceae bacterium]
MSFTLKSITLIILSLILTTCALAQSGRSKQNTGNGKRNQPAAAPTPTPAPTPASEPPQMNTGDEAQDVESVKVETNLVTVPIIVSDRNDIYVPDMRQEEFSIEEDGVKQELAFFASVTQPFHVVLMLDTSGSTQDKLGQIKRAADAFIDELQPADRVKLISFDDKINDYGDFTNDRTALRAAIGSLRPGAGTKLYDAMEVAIHALRRIEGRKAIVIFTDGVDWYSDHASINQNRRELEEAGIIVYPIRYDTREETERIAREQARRGQTIDLGTIFGGGGGVGQSPTPPPANPGSTIPLPPSTGGGSPTIGGFPIPPIVIQPRSDPNGRNDPNSSGSEANIKAMLDLAYATADGYLRDLAQITGGKLYRADTLGSLPLAFANIAAELRTQYSLGYYPTNVARDGKFRKLKVRTTRAGVIVRARPGYRAPKETK